MGNSAANKNSFRHIGLTMSRFVAIGCHFPSKALFTWRQQRRENRKCSQHAGRCVVLALTWFWYSVTATEAARVDRRRRPSVPLDRHIRLPAESVTWQPLRNIYHLGASHTRRQCSTGHRVELIIGIWWALDVMIYVAHITSYSNNSN